MLINGDSNIMYTLWTINTVILYTSWLNELIFFINTFLI